MKPRDRRGLERYVREVADLMALRDWTLEVEVAKTIESKYGVELDGHECGATCAPVPGRKYATLTFAEDCRGNDRDDLRQTVVHELVHCHFYGVWDTIRRDTVDLIGEQETYNTLIRGVVRHMEYGVDAVAEAIAPRMPLIVWPS